MKPKFYAKQIIPFIICCLMSMGLMAQSVIDPSARDPRYQQKKIATGRANTSIVNNSPQALAGCNLDNGCFIPYDNSYTEIPRNDDGSFGPVNLPFAFDLYGTPYTQVYINTNGNLTFNGPLGQYNPDGFPIAIPMVAAFWSDEDTRSLLSGAIHYKLSATNLIVTWDRVGYFNTHADKLNTFQIIIGVLGDPLIGDGYNVRMNYGNMEWALPDGTAAFGPATVGINKGDVDHYIQIGRFEKENCDYDGPGNNTDGIDYLEYQCFRFNVSTITNIAPSPSGFPIGDSLVLTQGETVNITPVFIGPEVGQIVTTQVNTGGLCGVTYTVSNGEVSAINMQIVGSACNVGSHVISFKATDNGVPPAGDTVNLTVIVNPATGSQCVSGTNLVKNPGFENGKKGFNSDLIYQPQISGGSVQPGQYTVASSAQALAIYPEWKVNCTTDGKHLLVNGRTALTTAKTLVWHEDIKITAGETYSFCASFKNLPALSNDVKPKVLIRFSLDSSTVLGSVQKVIDVIPNGSCNWDIIKKDITVPATARAGKMSVCIYLFENGNGNGNDLAIDNINLVKATSLQSITESDNLSARVSDLQGSVLKVFPNPVRNNLDIALPVIKDRSTLIIYNPDGKAVITAAVEKGDVRKSINVSAWAAGMYIVKLYTARGEPVRSITFIKQ